MQDILIGDSRHLLPIRAHVVTSVARPKTKVQDTRNVISGKAYRNVFEFPPSARSKTWIMSLFVRFGLMLQSIYLVRPDIRTSAEWLTTGRTQRCKQLSVVAAEPLLHVAIK